MGSARISTHCATRSRSECPTRRGHISLVEALLLREESSPSACAISFGVRYTSSACDAIHPPDPPTTGADGICNRHDRTRLEGEASDIESTRKGQPSVRTGRYDDFSMGSRITSSRRDVDHHIDKQNNRSRAIPTQPRSPARSIRHDHRTRGAIHANVQVKPYIHLYIHVQHAFFEFGRVPDSRLQLRMHMHFFVDACCTLIP